MHQILGASMFQFSLIEMWGWTSVEGGHCLHACTGERQPMTWYPSLRDQDCLLSGVWFYHVFAPNYRITTVRQPQINGFTFGLWLYNKLALYYSWKFVHTNLPRRFFKLWFLGPQTIVLPIKPMLLLNCLVLPIDI